MAKIHSFLSGYNLSTKKRGYVDNDWKRKRGKDFHDFRKMNGYTKTAETCFGFGGLWKTGLS